MVSFWGLFLLTAYGVLGGFVHVLNGWLGKLDFDTTPWLDSVPVLGEFGLAALIACILQLLIALLIHRLLSRPKVATTLVDTEAELRRVVWPTWPDTWAGTLAVIATVLVLLFYIMGVDAGFLWLFKGVLGG